MGEAKQKALAATSVKIIEASEQERAAMSTWFTAAVHPKGKIDLRRYDRLFMDFRLDEAEDEHQGRLDAQRELLAAGKPARPVRFDGFSAELIEYPTTQDVIEFYLQETVEKKDGKEVAIDGKCARYILHVAERMMGTDNYKAPSVREAEAPAVAEEPPPAE